VQHWYIWPVADFRGDLLILSFHLFYFMKCYLSSLAPTAGSVGSWLNRFAEIVIARKRKQVKGMGTFLKQAGSPSLGVFWYDLTAFFCVM
jgi:hypothetical protein